MNDLERYIGGLVVSQGAGAGSRMALQPWQRRFLGRVFGTGSNVAESAITVGRGNGKSALLAAVCCALLDGPLNQPYASFTVCAASFEQGRVIGEHVVAFLGDKAQDRKTWRVWDSAQQFRIEHLPSGAKVRCIGSDPRRAHGLSGGFLADEPAQWDAGKRDAMRAALVTALGKIPASVFVALGTRSSDPEHWFSKMLDGAADYSQVHAASPKDPPFRKTTWVKANPSLPIMPSLEAAIRKDAARAKADASLVPAFKALRLNLGVSDVLESVILDANTWQDIEVDGVDAQGPYTLGLDLGTSAAQSAAAAYWPATGALDSFAVFPRLPDLSARGLTDGVGGLYVDLHNRGELLTLGERVSDLRELLSTVLERWGRPSAIVIDRWREAELREKLEANGFPMAKLVTRGMGYQDGAEDVRRFRAGCLDGHVRPKVSKLLRSAMSGARTISDPAGNEKLAKAGQGRRTRMRDDAAAAAILAVSEGVRRSTGASGPAISYAIV